MSNSGFIPILSKDQCNSIINTLENYQSFWVPRQLLICHTIGAASGYVERNFDIKPSFPMNSIFDYYEQSRHLNPFLFDNFSWIYEIIFQKFSNIIGPCELLDPLGYPGFQIFGHKPNCFNKIEDILLMQQPNGNIHTDKQHEVHMHIWNEFKNVDLTNILSFTLSIELPSTGGGLCSWDSESIKKHEIDDKFTKMIKNSNYYKKMNNLSVISYKIGSLFYFVGPILHQIAPGFEIKPTDRRITMQGHGIMCDNIWRIYF